MDLSIVVLHYNYWDLTKDCLASIDAQEIPCSYEKVLVDNGSTNWDWRSVWCTDRGWSVYHVPTNQGHIRGQNVCFQQAKGTWVLFVANDVRLKPNCISALWKEAQRDPHPHWDNGYGTFTLLQPTLLQPNHRIDNRGLLWMWPGYGISNRQSWQWHPSAFSGSCYCIPQQVWNDLGGFDEWLETSYEDVDFCLRARKQLNTWPVSVLTATASHLGNATLRHQPSHNRAAFHRDRVYVVKKHYRGVDRAMRLAVVTLIDSAMKLGR
jgi:GT2 family glycosyltransferase